VSKNYVIFYLYCIEKVYTYSTIFLYIVALQIILQYIYKYLKSYNY